MRAHCTVQELAQLWKKIAQRHSPHSPLYASLYGHWSIVMEYVPNEQTTKKGTPMNRRKYIQAAADIIHSIHMIHILSL